MQRSSDSLHDQFVDVTMGGKTGWKTVLVLLTAALIVLALGAWMQREVARQPSLDDASQTVDLATLGAAEPPTGHVVLANAVIDQERALVETTKRKTGNSYTMWAPVTAKSGTAAERAAPVRFFYRRHKLIEADLPMMRVYNDRYEGVLVRDAMPEEAVANLRKNGIPVAAPHFVLDETGDLPGEWHQWWAIGGFSLGGILLFVAIVAAVQKARGKPMTL